MQLNIALEDVVSVTGFTGGRLFTHQRRKRDVVAYICKRLPMGSRILDVGCASGDIAVELAFNGYRVHAIDFEPMRLERAKALADKYKQEVTFAKASFDDFEEGETFDGILLGEVLEHFYRPDEMLHKTIRLLSDGGKVFVTTPNMPSLRNRLKFGLLGVFPDNNPEHLFYFDLRRFKETISKTPFEIAHFETRYSGLLVNSRLRALDGFVFGWFPFLFRNSGDNIFATLVKKTP